MTKRHGVAILDIEATPRIGNGKAIGVEPEHGDLVCIESLSEETAETALILATYFGQTANRIQIRGPGGQGGRPSDVICHKIAGPLRNQVVLLKILAEA